MTRPNMAKHVSAAGHFYTEDCQQVQGVPYAASNKAKAGQFKRPTILDAKKPENQWVRGVTSVIGNGHRPQLVDWMVREGIKAALREDRKRGEHAPHFEDPEYIKQIVEASKQIARDTAEAGTDIHAAIQAHYTEGEEVEQFALPFAMATALIITNVCGDQVWTPEKCVVSRHGYGTKIDLLSDEWILDFKTKDGDEAKLQRMAVYDSYHMQLAAGRMASACQMTSNIDRFKCGVVYVSRDHPGVAVFKHVTEPQLKRGWTMFKALLDYTLAHDNYRAKWADLT